jgi:hypothetical protein
MQLTEKKLKEMIKEAVKDALEDKDIFKVFISECLKYTISGLYENLSSGGKNVEEDEPSFTPPPRKTFSTKNESKIKPKNEKVYLSENSYINSDDMDNAKRMLEAEFGINPAKQQHKNNMNLDDDDEIMKLIGAK